MKIISHNINGLNAYVNNGKLNKLLEENADIYCFQEVKCNDINKINKLLGEDIIKNYNVYNSINTFKKGYAGVTTLIRKDLNVLSCMSVDPSTENLSGYALGRLIVTEFEDFILMNLYSINSGGEQKTNDRFLYELWLINYIKIIQNIKPLVLCGDLNVCATELDYWGNYKKAINTCPGLMNFEIKMFEENVKKNNLTDAFRHIHNDERKYSWFTNAKRKGTKEPWESRHGWRLDYFLISESLKDRIMDCDIYEAWNHVDHSPIMLSIK